MPQTFVAIRAALYAIAFVSVWIWLAVLVRSFDASLGVTLPPWFVSLGLVVAGFGAALTLACIAAFVQYGRGTQAPFDPPREFVVHGPYRTLRNPMYFGGFCLLIGAGLALRSLSIVGLGLVFLLIAHLFAVLYEERALERRFGDCYLEYKRRVGRWIPKQWGTDPQEASDSD
jgi:protein-S-isoprenylcysteine O-methyltransferase Ste14